MITDLDKQFEIAEAVQKEYGVRFKASVDPDGEWSIKFTDVEAQKKFLDRIIFPELA